MSSFGFDGATIGADEDGGHETKGAVALSDTVGLEEEEEQGKGMMRLMVE